MSLPNSYLDDIEANIAKLLTEKSLILSKELVTTQNMLDDIKSSCIQNVRSSDIPADFNFTKSYPLYSSKKCSRLSIRKLCILCTPIIVLVLFSSLMSGTVLSDPYSDNQKSVLSSGYVVQNLKGDMVGLFHSWDIPESRMLYVSIVDPNILDADKIQIIKDTILSEESVRLSSDGQKSMYFYGWKGATQQASLLKTKFTIPTEFSVDENSSPNGDISIILSTLESPDGYSGFTKSTVQDGHILKSVITIYKADQLSSADLETITRHEFGHALGIIHSSNSNDLMYPQISAEPPLISECDISALRSLYDGNLQKTACEI